MFDYRHLTAYFMSNPAKIGIGILVLVLFLATFFMVRGHFTPTPETDALDESIRTDTAAVDAALKELENDRKTIDEGLADPTVE